VLWVHVLCCASTTSALFPQYLLLLLSSGAALLQKQKGNQQQQLLMTPISNSCNTRKFHEVIDYLLIRSLVVVLVWLWVHFTYPSHTFTNVVWLFEFMMNPWFQLSKHFMEGVKPCPLSRVKGPLSRAKGPLSRVKGQHESGKAHPLRVTVNQHPPVHHEGWMVSG
jgi:hypothetical protein